MMDWLKHFGKLAGPLLLVLGICIVAGTFLLKSATPQVWPFVIVLVLSIIMAGWLYNLDRRRDTEERLRTEAENLKNKAEGTARELRQQLDQLVGKEDEQRDVWIRPMLQLPLKQSVVEEVLQVFVESNKVAVEALREVVPDAEPSNVRVNCFVPTSEGVCQGDVCNLIIPPIGTGGAKKCLQLNMSNELEWDISFRPNEGATGRVFVERRAIGVLSHPSWLTEQDPDKRRKIERWVYVKLHPDGDLSQPGSALYTIEKRSSFLMSDFQNRRVSDKLAWIISMPLFLNINKSLEAIGVFNVDCLECQLKPEQLRAIYYRIAPFAGVLTGILNGSKTDRVAIIRSRR